MSKSEVKMADDDRSRRDFLEVAYQAAIDKIKSVFGREEADRIVRAARASAGGRAKKRKANEREEQMSKDNNIEKAMIERPLNVRGLGKDSTLAVVQDQGKFSQAQSKYRDRQEDILNDPHFYPYNPCSSCYFFLRSPDGSDMGSCMVVEGEISQFGTSNYYISASDEVYHTIEERSRTIALGDLAKEDLETIEKKVEKRGDKYVVLASAGNKVLGTHDTREAALKQLRAIEANKANKEDVSKEEDWSHEVIFKRVNKEKQIVTGVVMEPGVIDTQGEMAKSAEEIEKAAHLFLTKSRIIGKNHTKKAKAEVVESYITDADREIGGEMVNAGSWVMSVKIHDEELWKLVKSGEITGFSVGGRAKKHIPVE